MSKKKKLSINDGRFDNFSIIEQVELVDITTLIDYSYNKKCKKKKIDFELTYIAEHG